MDNPAILFTGKTGPEDSPWGFTDQIHARIKSSFHQWHSDEPASKKPAKTALKYFSREPCQVSPPLLTIYLLLLARLQTRLLKMHSRHSERTTIAAEAKRACSFCTVSPGLGLGTVYSFSNSASSTFPVALSEANFLINSSPPCGLFTCTLVILSCSALWYLFTPPWFCWLIGFCLIAVQTLAILVALFSHTLSLLPHSTGIPFLSGIPYR